MKKALFFGSILLLAGFGSWWFGLRPKAETGPTGGNAIVAKGDFRITVNEEGSFAAKESLSVTLETEAFQENATITKICLEGASVKKDEILCELDPTPMKRAISQAEMGLQAAKNDVIQNTEELKIQKLQNALDLERAASRLKSSEVDLQKWKDLECPKRIKEMEAKIADSERGVADAKREFDDLKTMQKEDLVSEIEVRRAEISLKKAEAEYEFSRLNMRLLMEYDNPRETMRLENNLADDRQFLAGKQSTVESVTRQKESAVLRATTVAQDQEENLRKLTSDLAKFTIKSPCEGIVLFGNPRWYSSDEQKLKVGGKVYPHNPIFTIPDMSAYRVTLAVNEGDVNKVKDGLVCEMRPEAIPNMTFKGKVVKVSKVSGGNNRWWDQGGGSKFDVEIDVEGVDPRIRPGMKCKVEILIETVQAVLNVPLDAIYEKEGKTLCYVLGGKDPETRIVKVGRSSHDVVEITEGLKEGEKVALYDPTRAAK